MTSPINVCRVQTFISVLGSVVNGLALSGFFSVCIRHALAENFFHFHLNFPLFLFSEFGSENQFISEFGFG